MKKVKVELTKKEAEEVLGLMGNGYGNGDYYDGAGYGGKREEAAAQRAYKKIADAMGYSEQYNQLS